MKIKLIISLAMLIPGISVAQTKIDLQNVKQFTVENRTIESMVENGWPVLELSEAEGDGLVIINDVAFENGTIEFDLKGRNVMQQSFVGLAFHVQDRSHYEAIYFRPFNFMNADTARRRRAVQYISMPDNPWEKLREQHPGKYENKVSPVPDADAWFHVKVVLEGKDISVYVNQSASPSLQVVRLSETKAGKLAMWAGNGSNASFANLMVTHAPKKTSK
jgi:hypothetical protein